MARCNDCGREMSGDKPTTGCTATHALILEEKCKKCGSTAWLMNQTHGTFFCRGCGSVKPKSVSREGAIYHRNVNFYDGCDCNTEKGKYHHFGCDCEDCPVCGMQWIGCGHTPIVLGTLEQLTTRFPHAEVKEPKPVECTECGETAPNHKPDCEFV